MELAVACVERVSGGGLSLLDNLTGNGHILESVQHFCLLLDFGLCLDDEIRHVFPSEVVRNAGVEGRRQLGRALLLSDCFRDLTQDVIALVDHLFR